MCRLSDGLDGPIGMRLGVVMIHVDHGSIDLDSKRYGHLMDKRMRSTLSMIFKTHRDLIYLMVF